MERLSRVQGPRRKQQQINNSTLMASRCHPSVKGAICASVTVNLFLGEETRPPLPTVTSETPKNGTNLARKCRSYYCYHLADKLALCHQLRS